jgi:hypothetical protein
LTADKFNSALWQKSVSARFRSEYTERQQVEQTGKMTVELVRFGDSKAT